MSSSQNQSPPPFIYVSRPRQGATSTSSPYQCVSQTPMLSRWLSEHESAAPFHAIGAFRPPSGTGQGYGNVNGGGAGMWGSGPSLSSTGATWGSGQDRST
ncbi:hypothetical protein CCHL11_04478 [Colletotrichum chlorophyti]|uniref:Uncharacterized protein n=1 Tax=Colletotrichum chlorophyti TaxID=708187 RepID=A0A1Q8S483_9PEZI|nr:hypothetical protein CCHL11_04478 [Colletotrichum chlorophyti]